MGPGPGVRLANPGCSRVRSPLCVLVVGRSACREWVQAVPASHEMPRREEEPLLGPAGVLHELGKWSTARLTDQRQTRPAQAPGRMLEENLPDPLESASRREAAR